MKWKNIEVCRKLVRKIRFYHVFPKEISIFVQRCFRHGEAVSFFSRFVKELFVHRCVCRYVQDLYNFEIGSQLAVNCSKTRLKYRQLLWFCWEIDVIQLREIDYYLSGERIIMIEEYHHFKILTQTNHNWHLKTNLSNYNLLNDNVACVFALELFRTQHEQLGKIRAT